MTSVRIILALGFAVLLNACAQPRYETVIAQSTPSATGGSALAVDCSIKFAKSGLCLQWSWETRPTESTQGSLIFKTYRLNNYDGSMVNAETTLTPAVVLWMPDMGHGSSPTSVSRLDVGTYRAERVFFVMPGHWEIRFQLKSGNTVEDEIIVPIEI